MKNKSVDREGKERNANSDTHLLLAPSRSRVDLGNEGEVHYLLSLRGEGEAVILATKAASLTVINNRRATWLVCWLAGWLTVGVHGG